MENILVFVGTRIKFSNSIRKKEKFYTWMALSMEKELSKTFSNIEKFTYNLKVSLCKPF